MFGIKVESQAIVLQAMISETTVHRCTRCDSTNIFKNGHNKSGSPQFRCKDCGRSSVIKPKIKYTDEQKEMIIRTYLERGSLRGMRRLFGVAPATLTSWIKKSQHPDQDHAASSTNG